MQSALVERFEATVLDFSLRLRERNVASGDEVAVLTALLDELIADFRHSPLLPKELVGLMLDMSTGLHSCIDQYKEPLRTEIRRQLDIFTDRMRDLCQLPPGGADKTAIWHLPTLQGERVMLRAMQDSDAAGIHAIYGDPLVMRYTDEAPFPDRRTVAIMLASVRRLLAEGESLEWAVALRDNDAIIGTCGLHHFSGRQAEVGCLLRQSAWGRGYMAEAIGLLMQYAGAVLRLDRLSADVAPPNERAHRLFRKLGYQIDPSGMLAIDLASRSAVEKRFEHAAHDVALTLREGKPAAPDAVANIVAIIDELAAASQHEAMLPKALAGQMLTLAGALYSAIDQRDEPVLSHASQQFDLVTDKLRALCYS